MTAVAPTQPDGSLLTFTVAGQAMSMAASEVAEVSRVPPCTRIPNAPPSLCGLANIRGRAVPVISLAILLGEGDQRGAAASRSTSERLLVLAGDAPVGLIVDGVASLGHDSEARWLDPRALLDRAFSGFCRRAPSDVQIMQAGATMAVNAARHRLALVEVRLGAQVYALPLDKVDRVMRVPEALTQVPHSDGAMLGVLSLNDDLLPVVCLAVLLGLSRPDAAQASARVLVVVVEGVRVGLMVERVTGTISVAEDMIDAVPPLLTRRAAEAQIDGICRLDAGRRLVCLLSTARLFDARTAALIRSNGHRESPRMSDTEASAGARESFVIFRLGQELYGLPIGAVREVARFPQSLARVPDAPDFVAGIMSLRGRAVPVIDTARRFGVAQAQERARRVIVISVGGVTAGLAVDAVSEVVSFPAGMLQPAPELDAGASVFDRIAVQGADRMILLISPKGVIEAAERDLLTALAQAAQAIVPPVS
ncbi:MAG: chemotaxis protein CheW [Proteobacteria bacterium]|nr:chemotaxis protein CheW [Pseudomonadota bacterium]